MNKEQWFDFREIVFWAQGDNPKLSPLADKHEGHIVVSLVKEYLETGNHIALRSAAIITALMKEGVSKEVAITQPWLVIDKS